MTEGIPVDVLEKRAADQREDAHHYAEIDHARVRIIDY